MASMGNERAKSLYGQGGARPAADAPDREWRQYLVDKYVHRRFTPSPAPVKKTTEPLRARTVENITPECGDALAKRSLGAVVPDLISFTSEAPAAQPPSHMQAAKTPDFFSEYGL